MVGREGGVCAERVSVSSFVMVGDGEEESNLILFPLRM